MLRVGSFRTLWVYLEAIFLKNDVDPAGVVRDDCIYVKVSLNNGALGYPSVWYLTKT